MKIRIKLDDFAIMPIRAHRTDAGLDICTPHLLDLPAHGSVTINTGVHVELPPGTVGMLKSKSGLNIKKGITSEGVIDEGYTGAIAVKLYNNSNVDAWFKAGDKISQLVILPVVIPEEIEVVKELESTERGNNGFGSSGR